MTGPAQLVNVPGDPVAALLARHGSNPHALVQILREAQAATRLAAARHAG